MVRLTERTGRPDRGASEPCLAGAGFGSEEKGPRSAVMRAFDALRRRFRRNVAAPALQPPGEQKATAAMRKSALCKGASGEWCVVDFLLPADLAARLEAPIEFRFLEGLEAVSPRQVDEAIKASFLKRDSVREQPRRLARD